MRCPAPLPTVSPLTPHTFLSPFLYQAVPLVWRAHPAEAAHRAAGRRRRARAAGQRG